jgi:membrane-bound ClpP family serine protease
MEKVDSLSVIAGIALIVIGAVLLVVSVFVWPVFIYGIIALVLGIVILVTLRQQEYIEPIKQKKEIKSKVSKK